MKSFNQHITEHELDREQLDEELNKKVTLDEATAGDLLLGLGAAGGLLAMKKAWDTWGKGTKLQAKLHSWNPLQTQKDKAAVAKDIEDKRKGDVEDAKTILDDPLASEKSKAKAQKTIDKKQTDDEREADATADKEKKEKERIKRGDLTDTEKAQKKLDDADKATKDAETRASADELGGVKDQAAADKFFKKHKRAPKGYQQYPDDSGKILPTGEVETLKAKDEKDKKDAEEKAAKDKEKADAEIEADKENERRKEADRKDKEKADKAAKDEKDKAAKAAQDEKDAAAKAAKDAKDAALKAKRAKMSKSDRARDATERGIYGKGGSQKKKDRKAAIEKEKQRRKEAGESFTVTPDMLFDLTEEDKTQLLEELVLEETMTLQESNELQAIMALDDAGIKAEINRKGQVVVKKKDLKKAEKALKKSFRRGGEPKLVGEEVLEDGTDAMVNQYKNDTPGQTEIDEASSKKARNKAADEIEAIADRGGAEAPTLFSLASKLRKGTHSTTGLKLSKKVTSILQDNGIKEEVIRPRTAWEVVSKARAKISEAIDAEAARELYLFMQNERNLQRQKDSIIKNISRKMKSGKYDHKQAPNLWMYWVDNGAKEYDKMYSSPGVKTFDKDTKMSVAIQLADEYKAEIELGNYS